MNIHLTSAGGEKTDSHIEAYKESTTEKNKRLLKTCLVLFTIFIISLFIPFVHFFIPPFCAIVGVIFLIKNISSSRIRVSGTGICPECKKDFPVEELIKKFPFKTFCPHCRNQFYIEKN